MDLREVGCVPRDWVALAEDKDQWRAYVRAGMYLRVPQKPISWLVRKYSPECIVQNQSITNGNVSIENVEKFKYLGVIVTNTNDIEVITCRINMRNACYYSLEMPVAVYDGCGSVAFVYWLRLKQYL